MFLANWNTVRVHLNVEGGNYFQAGKLGGVGSLTNHSNKNDA